MWGGVNDPGPTGADGDAMTHMAAATAEADRQVAKIMAELEAQGELDNTLVVLTSDHGSVAGTASTASWSPSATTATTTGTTATPRTTSSLRPAAGRPAAAGRHGQHRPLLQRLHAAGLAQGPVAGQGRRGGRRSCRPWPAVTAVWRRDGDHYDRVTPVRWDRMTLGRERPWFAGKAQELVDTQAAGYGPDLIATLPDNTTYSVAGDHGGIQRAAQQIPIVFAGAGLSSKDLQAAVRSVDIMPTVLRAMGISADLPDGRRRLPADHPAAMTGARSTGSPVTHRPGRRDLGVHAECHLPTDAAVPREGLQHSQVTHPRRGVEVDHRAARDEAADPDLRRTDPQPAADPVVLGMGLRIAGVQLERRPEARRVHEGADLVGQPGQ